MKVDCGRFKEN